MSGVNSALISRKNTDFAMNSTNISREENNFKASIAILFYAIIYSIATLIGKFLGMYYPEVENSATNLVRGFVVIVIAQMVFTYNNLSIKEELTRKPKIYDMPLLSRPLVL